ncbi:MAG: GTPase Era [Patescibacteria group bacterium]
MAKSGMVTIIGRSNVGKSTLLNALAGTKLAITTPKPQTTRLPVTGILNRPEGQAVIVDTPGIMQKARDQLTSRLLQLAKESLHGVDAIIYVADASRLIGDEEKQTLKLIEESKLPKLMVINKMDKPEARHFVDFYRDMKDRFENYVEISALDGKNIDLVERWIFDHLPEGEPMYPEGQVTNISNEQWMAELIREKIFLRLREEVPYSVHVVVDEITTRANGVVYVKARIITSSNRYKPMIIGKGGQGLKEIGQSTRNELEAVSGKKYYLELAVEVDSRWVDQLS